MRREFSAGGLLVRRLGGRWVVAAIRPRRHGPAVWALPKGHIDPGERGEEAALREVAEETGAHGRSLGKLGDVRYVYTWEGERIFKVVSFFLVRYERRAPRRRSRRRSATRSPRCAGCRSTRRRSCSPTRASARWPARPWPASAKDV